MNLLGLPWPGLNGLALAATASLVPLLFGQAWMAIFEDRPQRRPLGQGGKAA
ncbi:hypothetical protein [Hoeflea sp.]|uniref:hypothetical protein n=1 Tax=Hoeflea sp. TaxID=1940281 RepID=UPI0037498D1C